MIDKIKLQEIYKQGATLADMKLIMEDIVRSIHNDKEYAGECLLFAHIAYIILCEYGFHPIFCIGLYDWDRVGLLNYKSDKSLDKADIVVQAVGKPCHAWIEIDNKILDIGIALQQFTADNVDDTSEFKHGTIQNKPVLFEPCHKKMCRSYLLNVSDKYWSTDDGQTAALWLMNSLQSGPGCIYNYVDFDKYLIFLNKYLPNDVTGDYIRKTYSDEVSASAPMKVIPFILDGFKCCFK